MLCSSRDRRDIDVIRDNHKFLWKNESEDSFSWEQKLAKRYWDKLFREYCVTDLSQYKMKKVKLAFRATYV